jgi:hypothetical protein
MQQSQSSKPAAQAQPGEKKEKEKEKEAIKTHVVVFPIFVLHMIFLSMPSKIRG